MYRLLLVRRRYTNGDRGPLVAQADAFIWDVCTEQGLSGFLGHNSAARPDAVLLDMLSLQDAAARAVASRCRELEVPTVGVVPSDDSTSINPIPELDDIILAPFRSGELSLRLDRVISRTANHRNGNTVRLGDLSIDTDRCGVRLAGKKILLTHKEYQLLLLLASNPRIVYTRESLSRQIWGYDYFGGTRTVDVHIRRLRSKIEDADHSFIETIRNVGYRFGSTP